MEKNKILKISAFVLLGIILVVLSILMGKTIINYFAKDDNKGSENIIDNNHENTENEETNEEINEDKPYIEFSTQLPQFNDDFEKALFIYGWFHCAETLWPYIDRNVEIEENYWLLKAEKFKTIQDMKNYAYEVFDKEFIDSKFNESTTGNMIEFKEVQDGILVLSNAHQYAYNTGYTSYNKTINNDGTISYKVNIKENLIDDEYGCDTTYEYKMEKNNEGKLVFKTFESPVKICLDDANSKLRK